MAKKPDSVSVPHDPNKVLMVVESEYLNNSGWECVEVRSKLQDKPTGPGTIETVITFRMASVRTATIELRVPNGVFSTDFVVGEVYTFQTKPQHKPF